MQYTNHFKNITAGSLARLNCLLISVRSLKRITDFIHSTAAFAHCSMHAQKTCYVYLLMLIIINPNLFPLLTFFRDRPKVNFFHLTH